MKLAQLKQEIDRLNFEIDRDQGFLNSFDADVLKMERGRREFSFKRWAEGRTFFNFLLFVIAVENGEDTKAITQKFLVVGAETPIKLTDKTLKAARDALAAGKSPDLKAAVAEAAAVVNARLLPGYNKELKAAITKRIDDNKKARVGQLAQYKTMGGK